MTRSNIGIYKSLHILLQTDAANAWIHRPNTAPLFNNKTALEKMLAGNVVDLADVRRFLDAERGEAERHSHTCETNEIF